MIDGGRPLVVLGLGNVLCGDDGLGVEAVRRLTELYEIPAGVEVLDGGTLGLSLTAYLAGVRRAVLVDAIRAEGPPGTLVRLEDGDVEPAVRERLSVHQVGVADLLDALHLLDACPESIVLLGLVPASLELGLGLSPALETAMPELLESVVGEIEECGFPLQRKAGDVAFLPHPVGGVPDARGL